MYRNDSTKPFTATKIVPAGTTEPGVKSCGKKLFFRRKFLHTQTIATGGAIVERNCLETPRCWGTIFPLTLNKKPNHTHQIECSSDDLSGSRGEGWRRRGTIVAAIRRRRKNRHPGQTYRLFQKRLCQCGKVSLEGEKQKRWKSVPPNMSYLSATPRASGRSPTAPIRPRVNAKPPARRRVSI